MLGIIIATHGSFSSGLKDAANVITGSADSIETVSLNSGDDVNILCDEIYNKINLVNKGNGVVIFVDLTSASPYNQSMMAIQKLDKELQKSTFIVSGVNLPMVLEAINSQFLECDVNSSIRNIEEQADQSIAVWNISSLQSNEEEDDDF